MIDFTACKRLPHKAYNGANGKKIAVEYDGVPYMLKFPPSGDAKPTNLSYTNSCLSEHIASNIFNMLGIHAQETILGIYRVDETEKVVCACKDFTAGGKQLFDFCSIKNTILDSDSNGSGTELADILETIEKQQFVDPAQLLAHFWNVFITDALLGNFDRHNGNWGFLYDPVAGTSEIAPVFDCGSCLLPQADEKIMQEVLAHQEAMHARVFQFPTSAIKLNDRKINYYDFLTKTEDQNCSAAVKRIHDRIDLDQINAFLDGIPFLSDLQRSFYKAYISARYELIIQPAMEMVWSQSITQTTPILTME